MKYCHLQQEMGLMITVFTEQIHEQKAGWSMTSFMRKQMSSHNALYIPSESVIWFVFYDGTYVLGLLQRLFRISTNLSVQNCFQSDNMQVSTSVLKEDAG